MVGSAVNSRVRQRQRLQRCAVGSHHDHPWRDLLGLERWCAQGIFDGGRDDSVAVRYEPGIRFYQWRGCEGRVIDWARSRGCGWHGVRQSRIRWLWRSTGQRAARVRSGIDPMNQKGTVMRACMLFFTGLLVGVGLHTVAAQGPNNTPNKGLVQVNHIGMNVPNLDEAVTFYTKTMGFPEAFRVNDEKGQARLVYVQVSKNTFFEIQPGPGRPAAINHGGIHVENMKDATAMFKARGVNIAEIRTSDTKAILNNITDPNGIRIELAELPAESMHRQAMNRWK